MGRDATASAAMKTHVFRIIGSAPCPVNAGLRCTYPSSWQGCAVIDKELGELAYDEPQQGQEFGRGLVRGVLVHGQEIGLVGRSEEHTSELQSLAYLVCRLLL